MYIIDKTGRRADGRNHDLAEAERGMRSSDKQIKANAEESARRIAREGKDVRAMREALIREHRKGRTDNVKDIHEHVKKHKSRYLNRL